VESALDFLKAHFLRRTGSTSPENVLAHQPVSPSIANMINSLLNVSCHSGAAEGRTRN
jgi:hypothetical protein